MDIQFTPVTGNARISGIQVQKTGDVFSDTDGLPDWWRLAYFDHAVGEDADLSHASDDADGDGLTNMQEYFAGTDPLNAASAFTVIKIDIVGPDIRVTWNAVSGKTYQLQRADSPTATATWTNVGSTITATGPSADQIDPGVAGDPVHFYRVVIP